MSRPSAAFSTNALAAKLARLVANLPRLGRLLWRLLRDRRVAVLPKALLAVIVVYVLSPLDLLPEFVPVLGALDDAVVAFGGVWVFLRLCPPPVVREHVARIDAEARPRG